MIKSFLRIFFVALISLALTGCPTSQMNRIAASKNEILKTDREFSEASQERGMKKAFIEYIDNEGILLRPDHLPIVGAEAIDYLSQINDSSFKLTWKPSSAQVSSSGDLGFSYGIYTLQLPDTTVLGTYVSIWKKQRDGRWKFLLDSGNQGIHNPADSTGQ